MDTPFIELTPTDRQILNSYALMLDGLGAYLGEGYELVLHSLESLDHSVIKIINGHYTGRKEGSPITDLALKMLGELEKDPGGRFLPIIIRTNPVPSSAPAPSPLQGSTGASSACSA